MSDYVRRRLCAATCSAILLTSPAANAATLAAFDFDDAGGGFTLVPATLDDAIGASRFELDHGELVDFSGAPGRALAASGFDPDNRLRLTLTALPGRRLQTAGFAVDLRRSASGPASWQLMLNGVSLAAGSVSTGFERVEVAVAAATPVAELVFELRGSDATSARGTLRLDNLAVSGTVSSVPLPAAPALLAAPLLALGAATLRQARRRPSRPTRARRRGPGSTVPA
ncbi:MAG: hypothetical protein ACU85V_01625 [Gammaproteobacteria bacterium]